MATPHVAAAAALVAAKYQNKTGREIKRRLLNTTTRIAAMGKRKKTSAYGTGLLNLSQALS
ncbi:MAG: S8 family serine peptidase [Acidobacteria bacterium]|nr:S8 family serine peptidase [Acidobacteriota bacterium]